MPIIEIEIELIGKVSYYHFLLPVKLGDLKPIYIYIYIFQTLNMTKIKKNLTSVRGTVNRRKKATCLVRSSSMTLLVSELKHLLEVPGQILVIL